MNEARHGHGVLFHEDQFMVVGGWGVSSNERCKLKDDKIKCTIFNVELGIDKMTLYPELMSVPENFCQK